MSDIYFRVGDQYIEARPTRGIHNYCVLSPFQSWFWPADSNVMHQDVIEEMQRMGDDSSLVRGEVKRDGTVNVLSNDYAEAPDWLLDVVEANLGKVPINFNNESYGSSG